MDSHQPIQRTRKMRGISHEKLSSYSLDSRSSKVLFILNKKVMKVFSNAVVMTRSGLDFEEEIRELTKLRKKRSSPYIVVTQN
jgi:hypothetical protein